MSDRTCPKCTTLFQYPSLLKRHFKTSSRCAISDAEIDKFFNPDKNIYKCKKCNKVFTRKSSLNRHDIETKCSKSTNSITANIISNTNIINNDNRVINNNTTNNQNNLTINNNTIIQHIYPFGFEDIRRIEKAEMLRILRSGLESGILIIKAIYSKIENKNFYKPNMSKSDIACLNDTYDLTIYKGNQFSDALFDRCISFLHHMLYLCKKDLSFREIQFIYDNIEYIEGTMRNI